LKYFAIIYHEINFSQNKGIVVFGKSSTGGKRTQGSGSLDGVERRQRRAEEKNMKLQYIGDSFRDGLTDGKYYDGKEIILRGKFTETLPGYHQTFIMGRQAMVCCANDTSLCGLTVTGVKVEELVKDNWYEVQGNLKTVPLDNGGKTLVLYANRIQNYQKPQDEFVYFS